MHVQIINFRLEGIEEQDYTRLCDDLAPAFAALPEEVWDADYDGGSNVVDVVIRGLRRKLADHASMIETLRGRGYRFRNG